MGRDIDRRRHHLVGGIAAIREERDSPGTCAEASPRPYASWTARFRPGAAAVDWRTSKCGGTMNWGTATPMSVYTLVSVGHEELRQKVQPLGELGEYLVQQVVDFNAQVPDLMMDFRSLGDSPAIGAVMNPLGALWRERPAPRFDAHGEMEPEDAGRRLIRVCEHIDVRWLLEDMFTKLRLFAETGDALHRHRSATASVDV